MSPQSSLAHAAEVVKDKLTPNHGHKETHATDSNVKADEPTRKSQENGQNVTSSVTSNPAAEGLAIPVTVKESMAPTMGPQM